MNHTDLGTKPVKLGKVTLPVGFGNFVMVARVVVVCDPLSAPIKAMRKKAQESHLLIDATKGRRIRSVIVCDSRQVILSAVHFETLQVRIEAICASGKRGHGECGGMDREKDYGDER